jgi:tetratricopeptide (TPR) repeat protein
MKNILQSRQITIAQALSKAKKATKQGKIAVALELYNAVLQQQPNHPIAKKGFYKLQKGLLNEQSVQAEIVNPSQDQINALVNLYHSGQMIKTEKACRELLQTYPKSSVIINVLGATLQGQGRLQDALEIYDRLIQLNSHYVDAYSNSGLVLQDLGRLDEAVKSYDKAIELKPDYAEAYYNRGNALKELGRLDEAVKSYDKAIQLKVDYAEAYSNRGNALQELGQLDEAVKSYGNAIQLKPNYAEAYSNRGVALQELGYLDKAVKSCEKAFQIKPKYADAYYNFGNALKELGQLDEAVKSYEKAIQLKIDFALAYYNLGNTLKELGQLNSAIASYQKAISINSHNSLFWAGFAEVLSMVRLTSYNGDLAHYLLNALEQPTVRPKDLSGAVLSTLHHHLIVSRTLDLSKYNNIDEDIDYITKQLSTVPLLLRVMELSPIADLDVEKMLTKIRKAMLYKALNGDCIVEGLPFYNALAMHCFTNEYLFTESEEEKQEIERLQKEVKVTLEKGGIVSPTRIAVLGAYRPLYSFSWAEDLLKYEWTNNINKVLVGQINNVREEQALCSNIPLLTPIDNKVSQLVRNQYEENPYPRWVNPGLSDKPRAIRQVLQSIKLHLNYDLQQFSNKPDILIAGCGTGQHALSTASRFLNCNVLAVDLSLSSLSYAIRKTQELGVANIEYMQGDILKLDQIEREFDIIESSGVLHHMDNPLTGWKVLVDKLRVSGLMKVGLYSEIARQNIVQARKQIAKKKYTSSPDDIRRYREEIINMNPNRTSEVLNVIESSDFYSLSACRDLLFHVQEHRFTLPQIEEALKELGLNFLGFELKQSWIRRKFIEQYPEKNAIVSFPLWHQFELENPNTFNGMYQFWVQKV